MGRLKFNFFMYATIFHLLKCVKLIRSYVIHFSCMDFNRLVAKRSVFHCFVNTQAELMMWALNGIRYVSL